MRCYKCKQDKDENEFNIDSSAPRGRHGYCKDCKYSMAREKRAWRMPKHRNKETERRRKIKIEAIKYKGGKCIDCGYDKHPAALCFHHLINKEKAVNDLLKTGLNERTKKELDKCVLLCHNCHDIRHYGSYKGAGYKEVDVENDITK